MKTRYVDASTARFRWNHNPRVGGSSPSSATNQKTPKAFGLGGFSLRSDPAWVARLCLNFRKD